MISRSPAQRRPGPSRGHQKSGFSRLASRWVIFPAQVYGRFWSFLVTSRHFSSFLVISRHFSSFLPRGLGFAAWYGAPQGGRRALCTCRLSPLPDQKSRQPQDLEISRPHGRKNSRSPDLLVSRSHDPKISGPQDLMIFTRPAPAESVTRAPEKWFFPLGLTMGNFSRPSIRSLLVTSGHFWPFLAISGHFWKCFGSFRTFMDVSGNFWEFLF